MRFHRAILALSLPAIACGNDRDIRLGASDAAGTRVVSSCGEEEVLPVTNRNHVVGPIDYADPPPVGGDHDKCWAEWTVHQEAVPAELWVHNLEHGGVVFLHNCPDGCDDERAALDEIASLVDRNRQALMTPYGALPGRFAAIAWGHRLVMSCIDVTAAAAFYVLRVANPELAEGQLSSPPPAGCD